MPTMKWSQQRAGFTIVELLIVVVVIAILAAITIVSYTAITAQANDSNVKSDLRNMAQKVELSKQDNGYIPQDRTPFKNAIGFKSINRNAYGVLFVSGGNNYNILYCSPAPDANYSIIARSVTGRVYYIVGGEGVKEYIGTVASSSSTVCSAIGTPIPDTSGTSRAFILDGGNWGL